jgi:hypothetical protein
MTTRLPRVLTALDKLNSGDHVGWMVTGSAQFAALAAGCLEQGAAAGQKLFYFSPGRVSRSRSLPIGGGVSVIDPHVAFLGGGGLEPSTMYAAFREQAVVAADEGYSGLRVVADMDWLLGPGPSGGQIAAFEQGLDAVAVETGATIVCAYRRGSFPGRDLAEVMCVHPHELGEGPQDLGFRIWSSGAGRWHVSGEVDARAGAAFPAALRTAAEGAASLWLDCSDLRFIDAAGMRAIARTARRGDVTVSLQGASDLMRRCWEILEWDVATPNLEFCT